MQLWCWCKSCTDDVNGRLEQQQINGILHHRFQVRISPSSNEKQQWWKTCNLSKLSLGKTHFPWLSSSGHDDCLVPTPWLMLSERVNRHLVRLTPSHLQSLGWCHSCSNHRPRLTFSFQVRRLFQVHLTCWNFPLLCLHLNQQTSWLSLLPDR